MPHSKATNHCSRQPRPKEVLRVEAGFDYVEDNILTLARFYFQSFAVPDSQAWMHGLDLAEAMFGDKDGPVIALRLLDALRCMRFARKSVFCFSAPTCEGCAAIETEHDRRLMAALRGIRLGQFGRTQTELIMLCEGNDVTQTVGELTRLAGLLPEFENMQDVSAYV